MMSYTKPDVHNVTTPKENRATDIGNMHKNLIKIARVVPEIFSRTDRHTQTHIQRRAQYNTSQPLPRAK